MCSGPRLTLGQVQKGYWTEMQSSPHSCQAWKAPLKTFALVPKKVLVMEAANMISLICLIQRSIVIFLLFCICSSCCLYNQFKQISLLITECVSAILGEILFRTFENARF